VGDPRLQGVIRRLNEKGFGFIGVDGEADDYFFHRTGLQRTTRPFHELTEGMRVEFIPVENAPKGWRAIEVRVLDHD
jgi:cold shock CspA family protein